MSFEEFAIERAKAMYQADGPDGSIYADAVMGKKTLRNSHGLEVVRFSLSIVRETFGEDGEETVMEETTTEPNLCRLNFSAYWSASPGLVLSIRARRRGPARKERAHKKNRRYGESIEMKGPRSCLSMKSLGL